MKESLNNDLINAVTEGNAKEVETLLGKGADPNAFNKDDWAVLVLAVSIGRLEISKMLLDGRANPNLKNNKGWTAFLEALQKGNAKFIEMLLDYGADLDQHNNYDCIHSKLFRTDSCTEEVIKRHIAEVKAGKKVIRYYWRNDDSHQ